MGDDRSEVHVDAKIVNRDTVEKQKRTFVAFQVVDDGLQALDELDLQTEPDAIQSDSAELHAIDFAMKSLRSDARRFRLICDNESVVKQLQKDSLKFRKNTRPILKVVWGELHSGDKFVVEAFPVNLADRLLNQEWKQMSQRLSEQGSSR